MRCYFMKGGHIADVEVLEGPSDREAVERSRELFAARKDKFDGFEVWERERMVLREAVPEPVASNENSVAVPTSSQRSA